MGTDHTPARAFEFLWKCHELSGGSEAKVLSMDEVSEELGLTPAQTIAITQYLERQGFIAYPGLGGPMSITALGILRVRAAQTGGTKARA